jgi:hypothetical protein
MLVTCTCSSSRILHKMYTLTLLSELPTFFAKESTVVLIFSSTFGRIYNNRLLKHFKTMLLNPKENGRKYFTHLSFYVALILLSYQDFHKSLQTTVFYICIMLAPLY